MPHQRNPTDNDTVPEAEGQPNLKSPWFLFNDFVVRNISEEEALSFPSTWKVSCYSPSVHKGAKDEADPSSLIFRAY
jgi:PAB-dependent poly(A)-specific ribonuclease subunit 2